MSLHSETTSLPNCDATSVLLEQVLDSRAQDTKPKTDNSTIDDHINFHSSGTEQPTFIGTDRLEVSQSRDYQDYLINNSAESYEDKRKLKQNHNQTEHSQDSWIILEEGSHKLSSSTISQPTVLKLQADSQLGRDIIVESDLLDNVGNITGSVNFNQLVSYDTANYQPAPHNPENVRQNPGDSRRVRFKSLFASDNSETLDISERELNDIPLLDKIDNRCDSVLSDTATNESDRLDSFDSDQEYADPVRSESEGHDRGKHSSSHLSIDETHTKRSSISYYRASPISIGRRVLNRLKPFSTFGLVSRTKPFDYSHCEDKDLLTGSTKYPINKRKRNLGRTFRGSYKYSRAELNMAILKKLFGAIFQKSTLALFGAFLIHITLGTTYTLSNINSYLTSYMRKHGSPNATYGSSMWLSSSYAVGQGFSMVLGGYIEKRFSAQLSCIIGCALHSLSIISTSWTIDYGPLAVLATYGLIPGFGCGLAYMTPMSNGFAWFPNRKGLVAGVILAGFGIGTFVFNMAQTAFVNPNNLSPIDGANGYFTQETILDKVPHLFVFMGTIYAMMQAVGCMLLFKKPTTYDSSKSLDERPILEEVELSLSQAVRTREFKVLFLVYGITTQGVLFVNSMLKEYGQIFIGNDMYLAWTGSMASIANASGRLIWGLAIDRCSFTQCFTCITLIFTSMMFIMPFKFVLSSKVLYLICTLGIFGSFSGWMSTYPVHLSRIFGRTNSGMVYGLIFVSQALGGIVMALATHYVIDHFNRFVPFFCVVGLELLGLAIYHLFYPKRPAHQIA